jgi:hypothetical protein
MGLLKCPCYIRQYLYLLTQRARANPCNRDQPYGSFVFRLNTASCFRMSQQKRATLNHAKDAVHRTTPRSWLVESSHTKKPNTSRPKLPNAAPAASAPAAVRPRFFPFLPVCSFFLASCFSIRVAAAGKIDGNARNNPPITGPNWIPITPAIAVTTPPNPNLRRNSRAVVCDRPEKLTEIFTDAPI